MVQDRQPESRSEVRVVGRLGTKVLERELPSGASLTAFSIVVDRAERERHSEVAVDTIACMTPLRGVARRLDAMAAGTWVEATGVLRRRFWRAANGLGSAMEVEVRKLRRVGRPD